MSNIPKPRQGGQKGGGGGIGQSRNRNLSRSRGGQPTRGGGGGGKKPPKDGCLVMAIALGGGLIGILSAVGYGAWELFN